MRGAELRDIRDLGRREIGVIQISGIPHNLAILIPRSDAGDNLQECCFSATRWAKNRSEMSQRVGG